jgi:hypothetical protein
MIKEISIKVLMNEVEKFVNKYEDEFEFIVDYNDVDRWEIDFKNNCLNISECCSVFVREEEDKELKKWFREDDIFNKKVKVDNYILYLII